MVRLPQPASAFQGREQIGIRPAVIVQNELAFSLLPTVLVTPFTSNLGALRFNGTSLVKSTARNGLDRDSVLLVFQTRAIDRNRIERFMGKLDDLDLQRLDTLLQQLLLPNN